MLEKKTIPPTGYRNAVPPCISEFVDGGLVGLNRVRRLEEQSGIRYSPDGQAARTVARPQVGATIIES